MQSKLRLRMLFDENNMNTLKKIFLSILYIVCCCVMIFCLFLIVQNINSIIRYHIGLANSVGCIERCGGVIMSWWDQTVPFITFLAGSFLAFLGVKRIKIDHKNVLHVITTILVIVSSIIYYLN